MACPECTAPWQRKRTHCAVCDAPLDSGTATSSREAEAACFAGIAGAARADETLLGYTRGLVSGSWVEQASHPIPSLSLHFANLGLTSSRLVVQPISPASGAPQEGVLLSAELAEVTSLSVMDADTHIAWNTVRLEVALQDGRALRLRARGRLAQNARHLAEAWSAVAADKEEASDDHPCNECGRMGPATAKFCPYCGAKQEVK